MHLLFLDKFSFCWHMLLGLQTKKNIHNLDRAINGKQRFVSVLKQVYTLKFMLFSVGLGLFFERLAETQ